MQPARHDSDAPSDRDQLLALGEHLDRAWDRRDTAAFAALFTPDADFGSIEGPIHRGRAAIRRLYAEDVFPALPLGQRHVSRVTHLRFVAGDIAIVDAEIDIVQDDDAGGTTLLHMLPAVVIAVQGRNGWRIGAVRLGSPSMSSQV